MGGRFFWVKPLLDFRCCSQNDENFIEMRNREVVALIAYLQRLGTDIKIKTGATSQIDLNK